MYDITRSMIREEYPWSSISTDWIIYDARDVRISRYSTDSISILRETRDSAIHMSSLVTTESDLSHCWVGIEVECGVVAEGIIRKLKSSQPGYRDSICIVEKYIIKDIQSIDIGKVGSQIITRESAIAKLQSCSTTSRPDSIGKIFKC